MKYPQAQTLRFNGIRLEPLQAHHAEGLAAAVQDGELWHLKVTSAPEPTKALHYIEEASRTPNRVAFAVIDECNEQVIGSTSFYAIEPEIARLSIGYTWYAQRYWQSHVNPTCKYLLMQYAFEVLDCACIGWEADNLNERSKAAILKLGAHADGVLRHHKVRRDGSVRDTATFSLLQREWPAAKARLLARLGCEA